MRFIDNFLNSTTMYRLALYALVALAMFSILLSVFGALDFTASALVLSAVTSIIICWGSNYIFAKLFSAEINVESSFITALILFLIMAPPSAVSDLKILALAGIIAMASKYLIAPFRRHIFNPAAFGAAVIFLTGLGGAAWWVGTPAMFPAVLAAGFLIVRKIKRFDLFLPFLASGLLSSIYFGVIGGSNPATILRLMLFSGPILFFGTIMLTEPMTTPPWRNLRIIYGAVLGVLFGSQLHFGSFYPAPEFILIAGNFFSYGFVLRSLLRRRSMG